MGLPLGRVPHFGNRCSERTSSCPRKPTVSLEVIEDTGEPNALRLVSNEIPGAPWERRGGNEEEGTSNAG